MNKKNTIFIIFGATGDLAKRKLIPGIYNLLSHNNIKKFHILAVARKSLTKEKLISDSKKFIKSPKPNLLSKLKNSTSYLQLDFKEPDFNSLKLELDRLNKKGFTNKIFYLATGSNNFEKISNKIKDSGILKNKSGWSRIVFEKPFGLDEKSSDKLNKSIKKIFDEKQIYRIDHYLGKELVENISIIRFDNAILEPLWNNKYVENIQIILDEDFGIEERGPFYDTYGAIRDVIQNHMLQLLALTTMEKSKSFSGNHIRDKKTELLKKVRIKKTIVGQYKGYQKEKGIPKNSETETFAAMELEIKNKRWKGVPIYFRTGKYLDKKESKIIIKFKKNKCILEQPCLSENNELEIRIFPNEGISFKLNSKIPGETKTVPVKMNFCHSCVFGPNTPEGYENLFSDIIEGNQSTFIREDELQASWKIVDKAKKGKLHKYEKGSKGPKIKLQINKK